jgi:hypothetical protein
MAATGGNSESSHPAYSNAVEAALSERVSNLGRRQTNLEEEMRSGFRSVEQSISASQNETRASIATLSNSISERSRPQWQALSVMLAFAAILGGLAYLPIREATSDLKVDVATLAASVVTREEMDWRSARGLEDRVRTDAAIMDIRTGTVTRNEWMERNMSRDHDIDNIQDAAVRETTNLQRQIDLMRADFTTFANSLGNGRDVIQNLQSEIERLRDQLIEIRSLQPIRGGGL